MTMILTKLIKKMHFKGVFLIIKNITNLFIINIQLINNYYFNYN